MVDRITSLILINDDVVKIDNLKMSLIEKGNHLLLNTSWLPKLLQNIIPFPYAGIEARNKDENTFPAIITHMMICYKKLKNAR